MWILNGPKPKGQVGTWQWIYLILHHWSIHLYIHTSKRTGPMCSVYTGSNVYSGVISVWSYHHKWVWSLNHGPHHLLEKVWRSWKYKVLCPETRKWWVQIYDNHWLTWFWLTVDIHNCVVYTLVAYSVYFQGTKERLIGINK